MNEIKIILDPRAFDALANLYRRSSNIRHLKDKEDFEVTRKALDLLLEWLCSVYELTSPQLEKLWEDPDSIDFDKMFKIK
jgi:hypothetical protein